MFQNLHQNLLRIYTGLLATLSLLLLLGLSSCVTESQDAEEEASPSMQNEVSVSSGEELSPSPPPPPPALPPPPSDPGPGGKIDPGSMDLEDLDEMPSPDFEDIEWGEEEEEEPREGEPDPNTFVLLEKEPEPVNMEKFRALVGYPTMAKEAEIEGKVILRVLVDEEGNYRRHILIRDPHPILSKAVEKKLPKLKFTPAIKDKQPFMAWTTIPYSFKLDN